MRDGSGAPCSYVDFYLKVDSIVQIQDEFSRANLHAIALLDSGNDGHSASGAQGEHG